MRTSASVVDLNDPALTTIPQDIIIPAPITSPQALRLLEYSLTAKARTLQDCGEYVRAMQCANGHVWMAPFTCHQRFCPSCADRIVKKMVAKYGTRDVGQNAILYIEITRYGELSPAAAKQFSEFIGEGFKSLEESAVAPLGTLWNVTVPTRNRLTARLLLWGDGVQSYTRYLAAWPGAAVKVSLRPAHQFHESLHQLFEWKLPKDPVFRADCEYFFHGRRMVHTMGVQRTRERKSIESIASEPADSGIFPLESDIGINSPALAGHRCPRCNGPAKFVSSRMRIERYRESGRVFLWWESNPPPLLN